MKAFVVDGVRTPIGKFRGSLSTWRTDDLAALTLRSLLDRHPNLDVKSIEDVILGCANQAGEDNRNVARMAGLLAGLPFTVPGETINVLCASGMAAVTHASRMLKLGDADLLIAGGVENMTRGPWVISKSSKPFGQDVKMCDSSFGWRFINPQLHALYGTDPMGVTAENLAQIHSISRDDQDQFACWSQEKAYQHKFLRHEECVDVEVVRKGMEPFVFKTDEFAKEATSMEGLSGIPTAFLKEGGTVTAGNASGLNDGSAALLLASENGLKAHSLEPLARIVSSAVVGVEPRIMGIGPVEAANNALRKAGLTMADMDLIELNEAFAAQALACTRSWGLSDRDERLNPWGGAIALGHPLGMTGARLVLTAARQLRHSGKRFALVTLCVGVGQGYAMVLENTSHQ